jgi:hypothetical protein
VTIHVQDDRKSLSPHEDLIEIGIRVRDQSGAAIAVTVSAAELEQLRDVLTRIAERQFE